MVNSKRFAKEGVTKNSAQSTKTKRNDIEGVLRILALLIFDEVTGESGRVDEIVVWIEDDVIDGADDVVRSTMGSGSRWRALSAELDSRDA